MKLKVNFLGIEFDNPLMPASGPSVDSMKGLEFFNSSKTGAVVTKTISVEGAKVGKPCIAAAGRIIHNTELWSEHSLDTWENEYLPALEKIRKKPLIASVGYTNEELSLVVPRIDKYVDFYEVSTHYGKDQLDSLVKGIRSSTDKPVFIKLSPHVDDYIDFVRIALENGANGVVAVNSVGPGMIVDLDKRAVKLGVAGGKSWVSGPAIKPVALYRVATIREAFPDIPIIACGGVENAKDVIEFMLAGADLVQMLSSALLYGRQTYDKIVDELPSLLEKYGFDSMEDVRRASLSHEPMGKGDFPKIDDSCNGCGICSSVCPMFALEMDGKPVLDEKLCIRCGLCETKCPRHSISGPF